MFDKNLKRISYSSKKINDPDIAEKTLQAINKMLKSNFGDTEEPMTIEDFD